jgi:hypothetical protein
MTTDLTRYASLIEELEISHELLTSGFGSLQEIDIAHNVYHVPHQLMASGLERLMKCYISLVYEGLHGEYPDMRYMKKLSHDLEKLLQKLSTSFYGGTTIPLIQCELDFITTDCTLKECIRILSLFGKKGRYYNIDIIAGSQESPIDPKSEWKSLELTIEDSKPYLHNAELLYRDYYPRVHSKLIAKLERLIRAIALQFTLGGHADSHGRLRQTSSTFTDFRNLRDEDLGTVDYRRNVPAIGQEGWNWIERSEKKILNGKWPARKVRRVEFEGEWPFRVDEVIVECQKNLLCIVNIKGYAFALNGMASAHLKILSPHSAGVAILGKSIGPFTDMAFGLCGHSDRPDGV